MQLALYVAVPWFIASVGPNPVKRDFAPFGGFGDIAEVAYDVFCDWREKVCILGVTVFPSSWK
jgi:hypothetical protein